MFNPDKIKKRAKKVTGQNFSFEYEEINELEKNSKFPSQRDDEKVEVWGKVNPLGVSTSFRHTKGNEIYEEKEEKQYFSELEEVDDNSESKIMEIDEEEEKLERKKTQDLEEERLAKLKEQPSQNQSTQQVEREPGITYQEWLSIGKYNGWISILLFLTFFRS